MKALRLWLLPTLLLIAVPFDADAQGRGPKGRMGQGRGPAFCRSSAGHPAHGWEWCRERGWDRASWDRWEWWERADDRRNDRDRSRRSRARRVPWPF
jgi:hypothetical protein